MKVAFLLGSLNRGGAESLVLDTLRKAEDAPFEMILIHRKSGSMQTDFYETGVKCIRCRSKISKPFGCIIELRRILKTECVDVIHTQQRIDAFLACFAIIGTKIKIVDTFHGFDTGYGLWSRFNVKFSSRHSDALAFVSQYEADHYKMKYKIPDEKVRVVYNGIDFSKMDDALEPENLPNSKKSALRMAMVGSFGPGRDQMTVCKFLKVLNDRNVPFDFYFVGGKNSERPELFENCENYCKENEIGDDVHFVGVRKDVPSILKTMDAFIYSTEHDTFGIAVVEAIASGLPVFVNDWGVMKEISNNGAWATLYETKNVEDLCAKFMDFVKHQLEYKEKAKNNAITVRNEYSIERFADKLWKMYRTL